MDLYTRIVNCDDPHFVLSLIQDRLDLHHPMQARASESVHWWNLGFSLVHHLLGIIPWALVGLFGYWILWSLDLVRQQLGQLNLAMGALMFIFSLVFSLGAGVALVKFIRTFIHIKRLRIARSWLRERLSALAPQDAASLDKVLKERNI
ncbi:MAG: hypothetical protein ABIH41_07265 [Nanoarchaeota archaeon]